MPEKNTLLFVAHLFFLNSLYRKQKVMNNKRLLRPCSYALLRLFNYRRKMFNMVTVGFRK